MKGQMRWIAVAGLVFVGSLLLSANAEAQVCAGDTNGDRQTTVDEIVAAVSAALEGCTVACPFGLRDDTTVSSCSFVGTINDECGGAFSFGSFTSNGVNGLAVIVLCNGTAAYFPFEPTSETSGSILGWARDPTLSDLAPLGGTISLEDGGAGLRIRPSFVPFQLDSCDIEAFTGGFTTVYQLAQAGERRAAGSQLDGAELREALERSR